MHLPCLQDFLKRIPSTNSLAGQESQLQHLQQHFQRHASSEALTSPGADMGELSFQGVPRVASLEFLRSLVGSSGAPTSPPLKQEPVTSGASKQGCCRVHLAVPAPQSRAGKDKLSRRRVLQRTTVWGLVLQALGAVNKLPCVLLNASTKAAACHLSAHEPTAGEAAGIKCQVCDLWRQHCVGDAARRCALLSYQTVFHLLHRMG